MSTSTASNTVSLLTTKQAAEFLGFKFQTLEIWRMQGRGPKYRKINRSVRYVESDLLAWLKAGECSSTSEKPDVWQRARQERLQQQSQARPVPQRKRKTAAR